MKVHLLAEGGLGDLIASTRFIAAAREKHPNAEITLFINNDNNDAFNRFIATHWSYLVDKIVGDVHRKSKNYTITSQFGTESYNAAFENIVAEDREFILKCDKFYNLHIDGLHYLDSDLPWLKYVRHFPKPENVAEVKLPPNSVFINLYARAGHHNAISKEQSDGIIQSISDVNNAVIVAQSEEVRDTFYKGFEDKVVVADLEQSLALASQCELGVSIDSGLRYFLFPFGKACYTLSHLVKQPFSPPPSHIARWYMWPEHMLPLDVKPMYLGALVDNALTNKACLLFPQFHAAQIDQVIVKRKYA